MPDILSINRLQIECIIGCNPEERLHAQKVYITVGLHLDARPAAQTDCLDNTINYFSLAQQLSQLAIDGKFNLIETLAERVAAFCLADSRIKQVDVTVEKPAAIPNAQCASIAISRMQRRQ